MIAAIAEAVVAKTAYAASIFFSASATAAILTLILIHREQRPIPGHEQIAFAASAVPITTSSSGSGTMRGVGVGRTT